jgi:hypothetical protein
MDASGVRLVPSHARFSEPARSFDVEPSRDDSAWQISALSTPGRSSEPTFGIMYSNNHEPALPKEAANMRLVVKKEDGGDARSGAYNGQYRVRP